MQYKSPIKILGYFLQKNEKLEEINLSSLKKRILAEFELSGKALIKIKSQEYSKNDILAVFENIKSSDDFKQHAIIARFPQLVNLLENGKISDAFAFNDPIFNDEKFIAFISPYVANSLGNYYASYLANPKRYMTYTLQKNLPVLPEHAQLITEPVYKIFDEIFAAVERIQSAIGHKKELIDASVYFKNNTIRVVNHLPRKYFSAAIDTYANCGFNLLVTYLQNKDKYTWYDDVVKQVFLQVKKLRAEKDTIKNINLLKNYFEPNEEAQEAESNQGCSGTFRIILGIIIFIVTISRIARGC